MILAVKATQMEKRSVQIARLLELLMSSAGDDVTIIQQYDTVGGANGREPVRHDDERPVLR